MNIKLPDFFDLKKSISLVSWLSQGGEGSGSVQTVDPLFVEIRRIEKMLAPALNRPTTARCQAEGLKPLAKYQKIMDLAG